MGIPKIYQSFAILMFFCVQLQAAAASAYNVTPSFKKSVVVDRLERIEMSVGLRFNKEVKKHMDGYLRRGKKGTELILGRSAVYFPIFEYYLDLYNLPDDLKYLTVIESALIPGAVSSKGAGGLWQFIRSTGRKYDLKINNYVDERYDVHKSSEAAARFLSDLYDRYGDWTLVIAAYNSGTVNVNRAIKKTGKKDFWAIRKHLPKETQDYVPKFIAATYAMNYYHFYDIRPVYPDYNLQLTVVTKVYERYSFKQLASDSGISIEIIRKLNPSYKKQVIPPSLEGYNLVLPRLGLASNFEYELFGAAQ